MVYSFVFIFNWTPFIVFGHGACHRNRKQTRTWDKDRIVVVTWGPSNQGCGCRVWGRDGGSGLAAEFLYERASWVFCVSCVSKLRHQERTLVWVETG